MQRCFIRTAEPTDCALLIDLKTAYVRSLYTGYIPAERLKELDPTPYESRIIDFLAGENRQILLCMVDGEPRGYLAIGEDPDHEDSGLIFDAATHPLAPEGVRDALIVRAAELLATQGKSRIHVWVLRDNFQARFRFERFNFKLEGTLRPYQVEGRDAQLIRYVYRIAR